MSVEVGHTLSGLHLAYDTDRFTMNTISTYMGTTCALTPRTMSEHAARLKTQLSRSREPSPCEPPPGSPCSDCRRRSSGSNSPLLTSRFQSRSVTSSQFLQTEKTVMVTEKFKHLKVTAPTSRHTGISGPDLAKRMKSKKDLLIIDCRPFISYNMIHITGAHSVNCCDKMTKKRLSRGKIHLMDLISGESGKADYKNRIKSAEVLVYDEDSEQLDQSDKPGLISSLTLVVNTLLDEAKSVSFLKGGMSAFQRDFEEWCTKPDYKPPPKLLYSPTTPCVGAVDDQIDAAVISQILPFLYIGNERDVANLALLREHGITHVLNVTSHIPQHFEADGLIYKRLPASDSGQQNLKQYFRQAYEFIDEVASKGGKVVVHCQAGVSRSATITISYIMRHKTMTMMDAFRFVKSKRSIVSPNFNFLGQLYELEQQLGGGKTPNLLTPPVPIDFQMKCGNV